MNSGTFLNTLKNENKYIDLQKLKNEIFYNSFEVKIYEYNFEKFQKEIHELTKNENIKLEMDCIYFFNEKHNIILNKKDKKDSENYRVIIAKSLELMIGENYEEILIPNEELISYIISKKELDFEKMALEYKLPIDFIEKRFLSFKKYLELYNK